MATKKTLQDAHRNLRVRHLTKSTILTVVVYGIAIIYFFPILYMFISGFKTEIQAVNPSLIFTPTLETYAKVLSDSTIYTYLFNSVFQVIVGTSVCLILGIPAAFVLVFGKFKKRTTNESLYMWFITTILLPPVAVLVPLYTWYQSFHLNQTPLGLLLAYIGFHIPIVVWMLHSFISDIPSEIIEASEIDGCTRFQQMLNIAVPLARTVSSPPVFW